MESSKLLSIGPFDLHNTIGRGAMGEVWSAVHRVHRVLVAIKFLQPLSNSHEDWALDSFSTEVRSAACLTHSNIVMILDHGVVGHKNCSEEAVNRLGEKTPYLVMEYINGPTWNKRAGRIAWPALKEMILHILQALAHAHARGVIHRDIKPENVIIEEADDGRSNAILTDFGLAHAITDLQIDSDTVAGTPAYMAPEQMLGRWRDQGPWTDLYSLGCSIWRMVSASAPYGNGSDFRELARGHLRKPLPALENSIDVPAGLEDWLGRLLAKRPQERFSSAAEAMYFFEKIDSRMLPPVSHRGTSDPMDKAGSEQTRSPGEDNPYASLQTTLKEKSKQSRIPIPKSWRRKEPPRKQVHIHGVGLYLFGLRSFPFIGRYPQRDKLWNMLIDVSRNGAKAVAISGPEGCGKSHLARWLCERAEEVGAAHTYKLKHNSEMGATEGIQQSLLQELRCHGLNQEEAGKRLEELFSHNPRIKPLIPKLLYLLEPKGGTEETGLNLTEWERHGLILRLLMRRQQDVTARSAPKAVIVWIDDAHWGADSMRLCRAILSADKADSIPVLFVLTIRPEEMIARKAERVELAALRNHPLTESLHLSSVNAEEHREVVNNLLDLSPRVFEQLVMETEGNPHFARETIADWIRQRLLRYTDQGFRLLEGGKFTVPTSIEQAWKTRILAVAGGLEEEELTTLELAAMLGIHVNFEEWSALKPNLDQQKFRSIVDELLRHRLARRWQQSTGWSFVHPAIPKIIEAEAQRQGRAKRSHLLIASMLSSKRGVEIFERMGRHLVKGGKQDEGISLLLRGAKIRIRRCEYSQASLILDHVDQLLVSCRISVSDPRWGLSWTLRLEIATDQNDISQTEELKTNLRIHLVRYHWPLSHSGFLALEGNELSNAGQLEEALVIFNRGKQLAEECGQPVLVHRNLRGISMAELRLGRLDAAEESIEKLWHSSEKHSDRYSKGLCMLYKATLELQRGQFKMAEDRLIRSTNSFLRLQLFKLAIEGINMLGDVYRRRGQIDKAQSRYSQAIQEMEQLGHPHAALPLMNLAIISMERRQYKEARTLAEQAIPRLVAAGLKTSQVAGQLLCIPDLALFGSWSEAEARLKLAEDMLAESGYVDADVALLAEHAARALQNSPHANEARRLWRLAMQQWQTLGDNDAVERIQQAMFFTG
jgi:eukaryotic-like serine/threonine-protein kinase